MRWWDDEIIGARVSINSGGSTVQQVLSLPVDMTIGYWSYDSLGCIILCGYKSPTH